MSMSLLYALLDVRDAAGLACGRETWLCWRVQATSVRDVVVLALLRPYQRRIDMS